LIGDAAHATTPNMGQGACQAIEDAYALGTALAQKNDLESAFAHFYQLRAPKAWKVVKQSWQIGKVAHLKSPVGQAFRNLVMRLTPASATQRSLQQVLDLGYLDN
ncbi:MAG: FAD-dependent monooxygenase, partial [Phaeodactylibacter sp.]|nr:FAD-dependent monooxygenase [Phaeodactylibacter sp.]